jgi:syntaxin 16
MAKNLKINLATRVGEASALFRKKQSAYLKSTSPPHSVFYGD